MPWIPPTVLDGGRVRAWVRASEGGSLDALLVDGRPVLTRTPWADAVVPGLEAAISEAEWVGRWRGGWQLCFPSTGHAEQGGAVAQGFHGVASQAPWSVVQVADDRMTLRWEDGLGLEAERTWQLTGSGIEAVTSAVNSGGSPRTIAIAEHLVLGGDVLAPLFAGATLSLDVPAGSTLAPLDYAGRPAGPPVEWPGRPEERWQTIDATTPARVVALVAARADAAGPRRVTAHGPHVQASVSWSGLPHLLLWEEVAASTEAPWNGQVVALGIEPTSTPHGAGTGAGHGTVTLDPGARLEWRTALAVRWVTS